MKLLIVTDNFLPRWDGIARFLLEILPKLKEHFEIRILAPAYGKTKSFHGMPVERFPVHIWKVGDFNPAQLNLFTWKRVRKAVAEADVVWTQTIGPLGTLGIKHARRQKKKLFAFVHSNEWELVSKAMSEYNLLRYPLYRLTRWHSRRLYNRCNTVMVPTLEIRELLAHNRVKAPMRIVQLGTNAEKFCPGDKAEAKRKLGIDPKTKVVGYCGRIGREKSLKTLVRAFIRMKVKYKDAVLLIVGEGISEADRVIKARKDILNVGKKDDVVPYLQAMDVYVLPSLTETSSLSTMEAMSCGLAVVSTPVGLVKDYIKDKENGFLFPKKNSFILSMKLEWLLSNDKMREDAGRAARKTIVDSYTWDRTAEKIVRILRS